MTTSRLEIHYDRNEKEAKPSIRLFLLPSLLTFLKAWLLGEYVWYYLSDEEIELLGRFIIKYRLIKRLREEKNSAK